MLSSEMHTHTHACSYFFTVCYFYAILYYLNSTYIPILLHTIYIHVHRQQIVWVWEKSILILSQRSPSNCVIVLLEVQDFSSSNSQGKGAEKGILTAGYNYGEKSLKYQQDIFFPNQIIDTVQGDTNLWLPKPFCSLCVRMYMQQLQFANGVF